MVGVEAIKKYTQVTQRLGGSDRRSPSLGDQGCLKKRRDMEMRPDTAGTREKEGRTLLFIFGGQTLAYT